MKRVRRAVDGGHWVEGDNPFVTDDSRAYGARWSSGGWSPGSGPVRGGCATAHLALTLPCPGRHQVRARAARVDRFADDPAFAVHAGGKLAVDAVPVATRATSRCLHAGRRPGLPGHRRRPALAASSPGRPAVAVVTDGSAVLGLGDIGPAAALPVMEGKAACSSEFGGVDAVPICFDHTTSTRSSRPSCARAVVRRDQPGGHLRPALLRDRGRLSERLDIPVLHDDQHGTAIVVLAALRNAAKVVDRSWPTCASSSPARARPASPCTKILLAGGHRRHRRGRLAGHPARRARRT